MSYNKNMNKHRTDVFPYIKGYSEAFALKDYDDGRIILVDTGARRKLHVYKILKKHNIPVEKISLIVITHAHSDHTGALNLLIEATGAPVLCHENTAECLISNHSEIVKPISASAKLLIIFSKKNNSILDEPVNPDFTFKESFSLKRFGVNARIIHTPGHTPGSVSVVTDDGQALTGDLLMRFPPRSVQLPIVADNKEQIRESIMKLLNLNVHTFYLSHGGKIPAEKVRNKFYQ